jgi:uncharacterized protein YidB (DUF937 family)
MNDLLGGGGLDLLESILGVKTGAGKTTKSTKTTKTTKSKGTTKGKAGGAGGAAALLPALLALLGTGGLEKLIELFGANGLGDIIGSWIGGGPNKSITPGQVKKGLGPDIISQLSSQSGLPATEVTKNLSTMLPGLVNHLTPDGNVPNMGSLNQALAGLQSLLK